MEKLSLQRLVGKGYKDFWNFKGRYCVCKGSRGSKKSKTTALWHIFNMMKYKDANTLVVRKTERTLKDSCYADLKWAIHKLKVDNLWKCTVNPLEIVYTPTGQKILFRGFDDPLKITSITVSTGVKTIKTRAFYGCTNLTSIIIPNSVTTIGGKAFVGCSSWSGDVTIPNNVKRIDYQTFGDCSSLTSITLPDGVIAIETWAFGGCSSLTSINIPDDVTSIGYGAFYNCSSLTSINIPDGVTNIEYSTFFGCSSLSSIILPADVTSIGRFAFGDCSSLTSITCKAITPPAVESSAFSNNIAKDIPVYVPCESVADYQADAEWSYFTNIQCMPEKETAVDDIRTSTTNTQKIFRDGQLLIIHNDQIYDLRGTKAM